MNEVNGSWHHAITLPVSGVGDVEVSAVACASPGNCIAAGRTGTGGSIKGLEGTFVVNEVNGTWHNAIEVPGISALNRSGTAQVTALSCARPGKCSAGGYYEATHVNLLAGQLFVVNER